MSKRESDIFHLQCWLFRKAEQEWKKTPEEISQIFNLHDIFGFVTDCYDLLHLSSYQCAFNDVELLLKNEGVQL